jgi:SAM-dependent methyltransferase
MNTAQLHWSELDKYYTYSRRTLHADAAWRYGPERVCEVAKEGFSHISKYTSLGSKKYCDLGCGTFHPFGVSAVMLLNGAASTISLDLEHSDHARAAEALYDLLADCLVFPEKWNWSGKSEDEFTAGVRLFNLQALKQGKLVEGISHLPMGYAVTDIHHPQIEPGSIDIMTSRAVLEHFLDFGTAVKRLYEIMAPGGVAFHSIDLVDHRAYKSSDFHYWSFLSEGEGWSDGVCNRLRSKEIRPFIEQAGFKILSYEEKSSDMPEGFSRQISPHFLEKMTIEDLRVTCVECVLEK